MIDSIGLGSVKNDIILNIFLLSIVLILSIIIWIKKKNLILSIFSFSMLSNLILYTDAGSPVFAIYNLKWLVKFTLHYWPWINLIFLIILIISYLKNKNEKKVYNKS